QPGAVQQRQVEQRAHVAPAAAGHLAQAIAGIAGGEGGGHRTHRPAYSSARRRSPSSCARYAVKRAAAAPSITRWSYDSDSGRTRLGANSLPFQTGFIAARETPRMATSGALTIGVNEVPPMPPNELIEKQPPLICAGPSLPSRALAASSPVSAAISSTPLRSQSRTTGTTSPLGVSAAKPMWKYFLSVRFSPRSSSEALNSGYFCSATTLAFIRKASMVSLTPVFWFSWLSATRSASSSVTSASSCWVT